VSQYKEILKSIFFFGFCFLFWSVLTVLGGLMPYLDSGDSSSNKEDCLLKGLHGFIPLVVIVVGFIFPALYVTHWGTVMVCAGIYYLAATFSMYKECG